MRTPKLCVYIPNLDGGARLRRALETLAAQTIDAPVVVIDNGSHDASPTAAEREMGARVIRLDRNIGFGRALNRGVAEFPAEWLVFLNNDVECEPPLLEALVETAEAEAADTVAGILLQMGSEDLIDSAGVVADRTLLAWDYLHGTPVEEAVAAPPPLGPTGGAALVKRDTFDRVGGFDERIFAYLEGPRPCLADPLRRRRLRACAECPCAAPSLVDARLRIGSQEPTDGLEPRLSPAPLRHPQRSLPRRADART